MRAIDTRDLALQVENSESITGLYMKVNTTEETKDLSREARFNMLLDSIEQHNIGGTYPIEVTMPCGSVTTWKAREEVPDTTLMCPCGDPMHKVLEVDLGV